MKTAVNKTGSSVFYHIFPFMHNPTNRSNDFSARIQRRGVTGPPETASRTPLPHPRHPRKTIEIQEIIPLYICAPTARITPIRAAVSKSILFSLPQKMLFACIQYHKSTTIATRFCTIP